MNAVGGHIRKLRKRDNMTQQALADRLNVTRQAVSQWENGNTQPDLDTLAAIAGVFGVDMMEVIYGEKRKGTPGIDPARRKRYLTGLIVFGMIFIIIGVVRATWGVYLDNWSRRYYDFVPVIIFSSVTGPLLYIAAVITALNGFSLKWDIRIQNYKVRRSVFFISVAVMVLFYITVFCLFTVHEGTVSWISFDSTIFLLQHLGLFLIPGIGLFLGLNGRRTERKLECRR